MPVQIVMGPVPSQDPSLDRLPDLIAKVSGYVVSCAYSIANVESIAKIAAAYLILSYIYRHVYRKPLTAERVEKQFKVTHGESAEYFHKHVFRSGDSMSVCEESLLVRYGEPIKYQKIEEVTRDHKRQSTSQTMEIDENQVTQSTWKPTVEDIKHPDEYGDCEENVYKVDPSFGQTFVQKYFGVKDPISQDSIDCRTLFCVQRFPNSIEVSFSIPKTTIENPQIQSYILNTLSLFLNRYEPHDALCLESVIRAMTTISSAGEKKSFCSPITWKSRIVKDQIKGKISLEKVPFYLFWEPWISWLPDKIRGKFENWIDQSRLSTETLEFQMAKCFTAMQQEAI